MKHILYIKIRIMADTLSSIISYYHSKGYTELITSYGDNYFLNGKKLEWYKFDSYGCFQLEKTDQAGFVLAIETLECKGICII